MIQRRLLFIEGEDPFAPALSTAYACSYPGAEVRAGIDPVVALTLLRRGYEPDALVVELGSIRLVGPARIDRLRQRMPERSLLIAFTGVPSPADLSFAATLPIDGLLVVSDDLVRTVAALEHLLAARRPSASAA